MRRSGDVVAGRRVDKIAAGHVKPLAQFVLMRIVIRPYLSPLLPGALRRPVTRKEVPPCSLP
jgi:hypothetical protein